MPKAKKQVTVDETVLNIAKDLKPRDPDLQYLVKSPNFLHNLKIVTWL